MPPAQAQVPRGRAAWLGQGQRPQAGRFACSRLNGTWPPAAFPPHKRAPGTGPPFWCFLTRHAPEPAAPLTAGKRELQQPLQESSHAMTALAGKGVRLGATRRCVCKHHLRGGNCALKGRITDAGVKAASGTRCAFPSELCHLLGTLRPLLPLPSPPTQRRQEHRALGHLGR